MKYDIIEVLLITFYIIFIVLFIIFVTFIISDDIYNGKCIKCIEYEKQCYKTEYYTTMAFTGKIWIPITNTRAKEVNCISAEYIGNKCILQKDMCLNKTIY